MCALSGKIGSILCVSSPCSHQMAVEATLKVMRCAYCKDSSLVPLMRLVKASKSPGLLLFGNLAVSVVFSSSLGVEVSEGNGTNCGGGGVASGEEEPDACNCPIMTIMYHAVYILINA